MVIKLTDDRGFGLEPETAYGEAVAKSAYDLDWFVEADQNRFSMNRSPVSKRGSSRMNKRARAGISKPTGDTQHDADLQRIGHYFLGYLDNYIYTAGSGATHTHEFYGGEGKELTSFRAITMQDTLKKYLTGLLINTMGLEVSDDSMVVTAGWVYKDEQAGIIGVDEGEEFIRPDDLDDDLFIMFYDILVKLNNKNLLGDNGIVTSMNFSGNNNLAQDDSLGFGAMRPQARALAGARDNNIALVLSLTSSIMEDVLAMEYGEVGARQLNSCKILEVPLEVNIALCEYASQSLKILFPKCTVAVTYDGSGTEVIKVNLSLDSLGSDKVTLADGSEVVTDMYVKLVNKQEALISQ